MVNLNFDPFSCDVGFGNPGYDSFISAAYAIFFVLDIMAHTFLTRAIKIWACWRTVFFFVICAGLCSSKIFTGNTAISYEFYGILIGIWLAFYYHFCLREVVRIPIEHLIEGPEEEVNLLKHLTFSTAIAVVAYSLQWAVFYVAHNL